MIIYISHSSGHDYERELYEPIRQSELYKRHKFILPHESQNVDLNLKEVLGEIDLVVAEVSYASTGQGIELGRADSARIPTVCFYKSGAKPSSSLRFVTKELLSYTTASDLIGKLEELLKGE